MGCPYLSIQVWLKKLRSFWEFNIKVWIIRHGILKQDKTGIFHFIAILSYQGNQIHIISENIWKQITFERNAGKYTVQHLEEYKNETIFFEYYSLSKNLPTQNHKTIHYIVAITQYCATVFGHQESAA